MHHNIPHRLHTQMVMRATNCAVCLDSIHFGRQVSVCQDCGASAHAKCSAHLPSTCGLPVGLAEHFGNALGQEVSNQKGETSPTSSNQGWVKIPRPGKATCWERKFMKVIFLFSSTSFIWILTILFPHFSFREVNFAFTTMNQVRRTCSLPTVLICGQPTVAL